MPVDADARYTHREAILLRPEVMRGFAIGTLRVSPLTVAPDPSDTQHDHPDSLHPGEGPAPTDIGLLWNAAKARDTYLGELKQSLIRGDRRFPPALRVGASMSECSLDDDDVCFRGRKWVPNDETLRTRLDQEAHDSVLSGHPGREGTYRVLSRQFYWPGMSDHNRRFCRNCNMCGINQIWRDRKHGILKPLPVPERKWRDISMDFIEKFTNLRRLSPYPRDHRSLNPRCHP